MKYSWMLKAILALIFFAHTLNTAYATVTVPPAPSGAPLSTARYSVSIDNTPLPMYHFWDTGTYNYAPICAPDFGYFITDQVVTVRVTTTFDITSVVVRPLSKNITTSRSGRTVTFTMPTTVRQLCVEFNGDVKQPLLLFSNPPDPTAPTGSGSRVIYYGPGIHDIGNLTWLNSGQGYDNYTLYIAPGAIVKGALSPYANNITLRGPGIFWGNYGSATPLNVRGNGFTAKDTILVNSVDQWSIQVTAVNDILFDNFKLISRIRDGININNSQFVTIQNSYLQAHDDVHCLKGAWYGNNEPVDQILMENCILNNQGGGSALEIGHESPATEIKNATYRNLDIIHNMPLFYPADQEANYESFPNAALSIHPRKVVSGTTASVHDIRYQDIRIEDAQDRRLIDIKVFDGVDNGVYNIVYSNIKATSPTVNIPSRIAGISGKTVSNVSFTDLRINGTMITSATQGNFTVNPYATNVTFTVTPTNGDGLYANYYIGTNYNTLYDWKRPIDNINFNWGTGAPQTGMPVDQFSIVFDGYIQPITTGTYTFYVDSDDGVRLDVDGVRILDNWRTQSLGNERASQTISLKSGVRYPISMGYYENVGDAGVKLSWSSTSQAKQIIPKTRFFRLP